MKIKPIRKKCENCGKEFQTRNSQQKTCTSKCCMDLWKKNNSLFVRDYYRLNKRELVQFMGSKCCMCGLEPRDVDFCFGVFVIDEIKPLGIRGKKFGNLSKKDLEFAKQLFRKGKIQLLCQNCSAIKSWKNNDYASKLRKRKI